MIHRDIKPSNLLIDREGKLWITDFGLARIQGSGEKTITGNLVGTLRYMSPEQLSGGQVVDQRTDVYSLGATLYELLTLRPAFPEQDREQLMRQILEREPIPPRQLDPSIPVDLETIVGRAMTKERDLRYQSAQDLADDLQRFLDHRSIVARPAGSFQRIWRWYKRSPLVAALSAVILFLSLAVTGSAVFVAHRETAQRNVAEQTTKEAHWQQYLSDMHSAMAAWEQSNVYLTLELLERHRPKHGEPDLRGFEWNYLWRQCHDKRLKLTINKAAFVRSMAFSHDGRMLATGTDEGLLQVWNPINGWLIHEFKEFPNLTRRVAFSPDNQIVASGNEEGMIKLRELDSSHEPRDLTGHKGQVNSLIFSPDGKQLATSAEDPVIRIWDVATGCELKQIRPETSKPTFPILVSPWTNNRLWVQSHIDASLRLFGSGTGTEQKSIERQEFSQTRCLVSISGDGQLAATAGLDGIIRLFDPESGTDRGTLGAHGAAIRAVVFSSDGKSVASSDVHGKICVWDLAQRTAQTVLRGHSGPVWPISFSPDGQHLCTNGGDNKLRIWDVTPQSLPSDICRGHDSLVPCLAFSPDGRMIASGGGEPGGGLVKLWDVASAQLVDQFPGHTSWIWSVAFSPDGKELASTGIDGTIRRWDLIKRTPLATIDASPAYRGYVGYSRDGRELISCKTEGNITIWDRSTGEEIRSVHIGKSPWRPALSPDGRLLVAGTDGSMVVLDYPTLKTIRRFPRSPAFGQSVAISQDGQMIAAVPVYPVASSHVYLSSLDGELLGSLDHRAGVFSIDFSPDGRTLATSDANHEVHLWDIERRQERATFRGHDALIGMVRFSPDGKTIASSSDDGTIRLWRSAPP